MLFNLLNIIFSLKIFFKKIFKDNFFFKNKITVPCSFFFSFLLKNKKTYFNSIKNFFLFKNTSFIKKVKDLSNKLRKIKLMLFGFNLLKFGVCKPTCERFYYFFDQNWVFNKQTLIVNNIIKWFFFNNPFKKKNLLFRKLKYINNICDYDLVNHKQFFFNFFKYFNLNFSSLIHSKWLYWTVNNSFYKNCKNVFFKNGDSIKILFSSKLLFYFLKIQILKFKNMMRFFFFGKKKRKHVMAYRQEFFYKNVFNKSGYLCIKELEFSFLSFSIIKIYRSNFFKIKHFYGSIINLYS